MDASQKMKASRAKLEAQKAQQQQVRNRVTLAALAGIAIVGLAFWLLGRSEPEFPGGLQGRWTSDTPGYEGRFFEVTPDLLTFETKVGATLVYSIVEVETRSVRSRVSEVLIHYSETDGDTSTFRVVPRTPDFNRVTVDHGTAVWTRSKT